MIKKTKYGDGFIGPFEGEYAKLAEQCRHTWQTPDGDIIVFTESEEAGLRNGIPPELFEEAHRMEADAIMRKLRWKEHTERRDDLQNAFRGVYWEGLPEPPERARGRHFTNWSHIPTVGGCATLLTKTQARRAGHMVRDGAQPYATIGKYNLYCGDDMDPIRVK